MSNLQRFLTAQQSTYQQALNEIRAGKKQSHWIWFIFPQISDAGKSRNANYYRIQSREEAVDFLAHPILGARLIEISSALLHHNNKTATEILGEPDDLKVQSCMTLFHHINPEISVFKEILEKLYQGKECERTHELLSI